MESERRPADIGKSSILAGQAHRRIDLLLDRVKELTEERDAMRKAWDEHECSENGTLRRALEEVTAKRDFDAVVDHCDECATVRAERDDAIERAEQFERERDQARHERDEWMRSHTELGRRLESAHEINATVSQQYRDVREERDALAKQVENAEKKWFEVAQEIAVVAKERDEARHLVDSMANARALRVERAEAERDEEIRRYNEVAERAEAMVRKAEAERDELRHRLERGHVCTSACAPNAHVAFVGREELDHVKAERDHANTMVANLRGVLSSIVESIERQEPKSCNCGAVSLLPRHTDPDCPFHGKDSES